MDLNIAQNITRVAGASAGNWRGIARAPALEGGLVAVADPRGGRLGQCAGEIPTGGAHQYILIIQDMMRDVVRRNIAATMPESLGPAELPTNNGDTSRAGKLEAGEGPWTEPMPPRFRASAPVGGRLARANMQACHHRQLPNARPQSP